MIRTLKFALLTLALAAALPATRHGMQGYGNVSGKYSGTSNNSMSTGLMVSEGDCDANGARH